MESSNNTLGGSGIHCKVCCNDQFRRFLFNGTEFHSLHTQVQQLLALDKEFVLKYKDNEGDLITVSTNEELTSALTYSEGNVLRLTAIPVGVISEKASDPMDVQYDQWRHPGGRCRGKYRGRGGRYGGGRWENNTWKERLLAKKEKLQKIVAEFSQYESLSPEQQRKLSKVQDKVRVIDDRLSNCDRGMKDKGKRRWEKEEKKEEKKEDKKEDKKEKKEKKKEKKLEKLSLSDETKIEIAKIKSQIDLVKPGLCNVKNQIKEKKLAMSEMKLSGGDTEQLKKEIAELVILKDLASEQLHPLKKKIKELKNPKQE